MGVVALHSQSSWECHNSHKHSQRLLTRLINYPEAHYVPNVAVQQQIDWFWLLQIKNWKLNDEC